MSVGKDILFRVGIIYFVVLVAAISIIGKAVYTQLSQGDELKKMQAGISLTDIIIEPNRGDILAADGRLLATSLPSYEIRMDTRVVDEQMFNDSIDALCRSLSNLLGRKPASMYKQKIVAARNQN